ncbi:restriction endonuclease [Ralstonia pseudosolanacearum]|uniref:restriction endonuclease n=1 Tax=Ralstonia pseudosolanacearum TaxID=1310165 RepID=UPI0018D1F607|nr:restriction endonuclease [Ralstonia pseudosolanacearum]
MSISKSWRIPSNWQDFEELCEQLLEREHRPCRAHRYGRAGQDQHGVDITIMPEGETKPIGVQCKLRSELTGSQLNDTDVRDIYKTSLRFPDGLTLLKIATTCPPDTSATDLCTRISNSFQQKHPIEPLFWPDIESLLDKHEDVACKFYPEAFSPDRCLTVDRVGHLHISLPQLGWEQRLRELFRHKGFLAVTGAFTKPISTILSELIANALDPGKGGASVVRVEVRSDAIVLLDDGKKFNSVTTPLPAGKRQHGLRTVRQCLDNAQGQLIYSYVARDPKASRFHTTQLDILPPVTALPDPCRSALELEYIISREDARRFVAKLAVPADCKTYTLRLALNGIMVVSTSAADEVLEELVKVMDGRPLVLEIERDGSDARELAQWARRHSTVSIRYLQ